MVAKSLILNAVRALPVGAVVGALVLIVTIIANKANWETEGGESQEKIKRQANRGSLVSILSAIILNIVGVIMVNKGISEEMIITNFGFLFAPVLGFMLDQSIGTDKGWEKFSNGRILEGLNHAFTSLTSGNFIRYVVTVFLDLFISSPLQDIMKFQANASGLIEKLAMGNIYDKYISKNFPSLLQSIVGMVTFQAYTNQTRFAWAYASPDIPKEDRIPSGVMMVSTAIAAVMFVGFYKLLSMIMTNEGFNINTKLVYTLFAILLVYILNDQQLMDAPEKETPQDNVAPRRWRTIVGILIFAAFFGYGVVLPFVR